MEKKKSKIKKWIFSHLLKRYLVSVDDKFLDLITKRNIDVNIHFGNEYARQEYERIVKILSSPHYKEFFYKAIHYNIKKDKPVIKPYGNSIIDKILKSISKAYLYVFDRKLYDSIELYSKWKNKIAKINAKADEYMAKTTVQQRIDRCVEIGILSKESSENLKDNDDFSVQATPDDNTKIVENVVQKPKRVYKKRKPTISENNE